MSDIKFYCTSCGKKLGIDSKAIGLSVPCPRCKTKLRVPEKSEAPKVPESVPAPPPAPAQTPFQRPSTTVVPGVESRKKSPLLTPTPKPPTQRPLRSKPQAAQPVSPPASAPAQSKPSVTQSLSVPPPKKDTREKDELNRRIRKLEEKSAAQDADLTKSRGELKKTQDERDKIKNELTEKDTAAANVGADSNEKIKQLNEEKTEVQTRLDNLAGQHAAQKEKIKELETALNEQSSTVNKAAKVSVSATDKTKVLEEQVARLNRELETRKELVKKLSTDLEKTRSETSNSTGSAEELEKKNVNLSKALEMSATELKTITKERDELLVYKRDAKALSNAMTELQTQLKELREQEQVLKNTVEKAEGKKSGTSEGEKKTTANSVAEPWQYADPIQRARKWTIIFAGIAVGAIICSVLFVVFWPGLREGDSANAASAMQKLTTQADADVITTVLGESFAIDGVDVLISRARVAPVEIITLLGENELSKELYFILDVKLANSGDEEIILRKPWKESRLVDNRGRRLLPAFNEPIELHEVQGVILNATIAAGEELDSVIIFEWMNTDATAYTLTVNPGFRNAEDNGKITPISYRKFEVLIQRDMVE